MGDVIRLPDAPAIVAMRDRIARLQDDQARRRILIQEQVADMESNFQEKQRELDNLVAQLPENQ